MLKRYTMWLWIAVVLMFLTGVIHAISLFFRPEPQTESDRQLIQLMTTYRHDLGAGSSLGSPTVREGNLRKSHRSSPFRRPAKKQSIF